MSYSWRSTCLLCRIRGQKWTFVNTRYALLKLKSLAVKKQAEMAINNPSVDTCIEPAHNNIVHWCSQRSRSVTTNFLEPDLGPNYLQSLSADDMSRQTVKVGVIWKGGLQMGISARKPVFGGMRTTQAQTSLFSASVFGFWKVSYLNLLHTKCQFSS